VTPPPGVRVVVLLGPPGSGKSTVGAELGRLGFRWREWEPLILSRWGTRDRFVAAKAEALPALHAEIRAWVESAGPPAVIESTGLSDRALLDGFEAAGGSHVVRLEVPEDVALDRVAVREQGRHLTDDVDANRRIWHEFAAEVAPHRRADLVIDTVSTSPAEAAAHIAATIS
jgi:shikimate kinase